jgi:hypothetical protein
MGKFEVSNSSQQVFRYSLSVFGYIRFRLWADVTLDGPDITGSARWPTREMISKPTVTGVRESGGIDGLRINKREDQWIITSDG